MMDRTTFLRAAAASGLALVVGPGRGGSTERGEAGAAAATRRNPVRIQRLSWAGVRFETDTHTLLIDPFENTESFPGSLLGRAVPVESSTARRYVLLTHLHGDHYDRVTLRRLFDEDGARGAVVAVSSMAADIAGARLPTRATELWQPQSLGPFTVVPVPAVDGFGGEQVAWVVRVGERRWFHGGDGLWHGRMVEYGALYGPFDGAFLPINGVTTPASSPPVLTPRTLGPAQAADAALALGARVMIPIHYGVHVEGDYEEAPDAVTVARRETESRGIAVRIVADGEWVAP